MKRTICILVTFIFVSNLLAQVKCIVDYPDLNVTYKRTTVSESEVTIDFLLLYCGKQPIWTTFSSATFYDDEGNEIELIQYPTANTRTSYPVPSTITTILSVKSQGTTLLVLFSFFCLTNLASCATLVL